jgi:8-oxo-dGTP pyrophosphatase MutT (NUDIX family)
MVASIRGLVTSQASCFERTCLPGHITASAWIVSHDHRRILLTHHRKLGRWLQLGGHADGQTDVADVALREAQEESGMHDFEWVPVGGRIVPIDVDVHRIPARKHEPAHEHHDIRFLLIAKPEQRLRISDESVDLRWFDVDETDTLDEILAEESLARLARKARIILRDLG